MLVVEAMEVVGDANRVRGNALRPACRKCVPDECRQLGDALHELPLLGRERAGK